MQTMPWGDLLQICCYADLGTQECAPWQQNKTLTCVLPHISHQHFVTFVELAANTAVAAAATTAAAKATRQLKEPSLIDFAMHSFV